MPDVVGEHQFIMFDLLHFHKSDSVFHEPVNFEGSAILCHFMQITGRYGIHLQYLLYHLRNFYAAKKLAMYTRHKVHMSCFRIETYLLRRHTPNGHILL